MVVESITIITLFMLLLFGFLRSGKKEYAIAVVPLVIVPLFQILIGLTNEMFEISLSVDMRAAIQIIGLVIAIIAIVLASQHVKAKKPKLIFIILCSGFTTLLSLIYLYNNYYG